MWMNQEGIKFDNLGDKTFETDFNTEKRVHKSLPCKILILISFEGESFSSFKFTVSIYSCIFISKPSKTVVLCYLAINAFLLAF